MKWLRIGLRSSLPSVACALAAAGCSGTPAPTEQNTQSKAATEETPTTAQAGVRPNVEGDARDTLRVSALPVRLQRRLLGADANHDGVLVSDELGRYYAARTLQRFERLGPSPDRKVELASMAAGARAWLTPADTNADGAISSQEFLAFEKARWRDGLRKADVDGDGFLTKEELGAVRWAHLHVADKNGDGKLSFAEVDEAFAGVKRSGAPGVAHGEEG
jgi:Ca2+-binding EF-hand superfamily protein